MIVRAVADRDSRRVLAVITAACLVPALAAIVYAAFSGERWPLLLAATMVVGALVVCIGELLL